MKHLQLAIAIAAPLVVVGIGAAQDRAVRMNKAGETFVMKAEQGGLAEVELGNLAMQRGANQKVKDFGHQMVMDHTKAGDELKTIASNKGVSGPAGIDAKSEAAKQRLSSLSGAAFDRAYMEDMVRDHKEDVAEFQREANNGSDPDLKAFAQKTLPTLQHHLQLAEDTLAAVK
jgi:putative membrane protein